MLNVTYFFVHLCQAKLALVPYARPLHVGDFDQHKHCREEEEEEEEGEGEGEGEVPPPRALSFCEWCSVLQILLSFWTCISASGPNERKVSLLSLILVNMQLPMASASGDYSYSHDYSYDDGRAFGAGGGSKRVGGGEKAALLSRCRRWRAAGSSAIPPPSAGRDSPTAACFFRGRPQIQREGPMVRLVVSVPWA